MERTDEMPEWVYLGLWGLNSRIAALSFMWICAVVGSVSLVATGRYPMAQWGAYMLLAVPWYWLSIRWVDQHGSWTRTESS